MVEPLHNGHGPRAADGAYLRQPDGDEKLSASVLVRLTLAQMRSLQRAASAADTSAPGYLRQLLADVLKT